MKQECSPGREAGLQNQPTVFESLRSCSSIHFRGTRPRTHEPHFVMRQILMQALIEAAPAAQSSRIRWSLCSVNGLQNRPIKCSSAGRASGYKPDGHGFDSRQTHRWFPKRTNRRASVPHESQQARNSILSAAVDWIDLMRSANFAETRSESMSGDMGTRPAVLEARY